MAGVPDYSTTASSNTSVGGVSIAEGWAPSSVNNSIRALMADIATLTKGGAKVAEITVASASTCDILGALSDFVAISGTTTITSLGTGANRLKFVRFTGALTLTHSGTSLILPGAANITTAAGDCMLVESDASSNARVLAYQAADGGPVVLAARNVTSLTADGSPDTAADYLISYDASASALKKVLMSSIVPVGAPAFQARLTLNGSNLQLDRLGGQYLFINGTNQSIPSGGVTLAVTGASSSTTYYIYAYMSSGTMTLEFSATAPATDGTYGHKIKTGDSTRTLVGMARANGSTAWADSAAQRFVISFFNRRSIGAQNAFTSSKSRSSSSYGELDSGTRVEFLTWADEAVTLGMNGTVQTASASANILATAIGIDGTTAEDMGGYESYPGAATTPITVAGALTKNGLSEGYHYATLLGLTSAAGAGTWAGSASAGPNNRCSLNVGIRG